MKVLDFSVKIWLNTREKIIYLKQNFEFCVFLDFNKQKKMKNPYLLPIINILFFLSSNIQANTRQIQCKVVGVADGDTLTCLHGRNQLKVRLQHIDAPENGQAFGQKAKNALSQMVFKKQVRLEINGYDRYNRLLAVVWDNKRNVNLSQVEQGMAWAYSQTQPQYQQAEQIARQKRLGLWADKNPINPHDWRTNKRLNSTENLQKTPKNAPLTSSVNCNIKRSCSYFKDNYNAALAHFQQCGWKEMDGNNDGIPCNKLYRKAQQR